MTAHLIDDTQIIDFVLTVIIIAGMLTGLVVLTRRPVPPVSQHSRQRIRRLEEQRDEQ